MNIVNELTVPEEALYNTKKKSTFMAYLLLFFLGPLGAHYFYIGGEKCISYGLTIWLLIYFMWSDVLIPFVGVDINNGIEVVYYLWVVCGIIHTVFAVSDRNDEIANDIIKKRG